MPESPPTADSASTPSADKPPAEPTDTTPSKASRKREGDRQNTLRVAILALVGTLLGTVLSAAGTIKSTQMTTDSTRREALRAQRIDAYTTYISDLPRQDELLWEFMDVRDSSERRQAFYKEAKDIQAKLAGGSAKARLLTQNKKNTAAEQDVLDALAGVDATRGRRFELFKCATELQEPREDCPKDPDIDAVVSQGVQDVDAKRDVLIMAVGELIKE